MQWPGLVGKGDEDGQEPPISLVNVGFSAAAEVNGRKFDGIIIFISSHTNPEASAMNLKISLISLQGVSLVLVAPVWPGTGDSPELMKAGKILEAVKMAADCQSVQRTRCKKRRCYSY